MTIKFNKRIYHLPAIESAISDWRDFAKFKIREGKNYFLVDIGSGQKKIADEFSNYILSAMKNYPEINVKIR